MSFDIEKAFSDLEQLTSAIEETENEPYLESLIFALRAIQTEEPLDLPNQKTEESLASLKKSFLNEDITSESIRKVIQLSLIKGMKGSTQHQHVVTPDSVAMFMGYFIQKLMPETKQFSLFDPASGAANLLTAVINQVEADVTGYGSEIDPTLIQLAVESANLQKVAVEYFHQDSLTPLLLEPVDTVVADLPVGYYPNDEQAAKFELNADEGHAFSHHLFIEQSMMYTKEAGYLLFLIPNFLFTSEQSDKLQKYLRHNAHILAMLQLPLSMFSSEQHAKSILVLQKQGKDTKPPKETLMAQLPSFKDVHATQNILKKIDDWFKSEK
ncbi:site-specific DNA-methyltransferase (adenine-specific) [Gracilibacillus orientalis]|uniref:Site-specific DNA-methyltransferase (Adenine-specific) n=1 Tax=Gracilibacillus orientalis TaxID=334253 RepID=A0A1I4MZS4_9BACI|nr:class I SAM-dependent methyltransferase [Gracilibacillus orientalis]SFM08503.1 site-specific DNA-methyltransferase (adenine-specific) [Gracilibacillus orientalis]